MPEYHNSPTVTSENLGESLADKKTRSRLRTLEWRKHFKETDPAGFQLWQQKANKKYYEKHKTAINQAKTEYARNYYHVRMRRLRADPEKLQEYREKHRKYNRKNYAKQRSGESR